MVVGLKPPPSPPPQDRAVELRLVRAPAPAPPPEPARPRPQRSNAVPPRPPRLTPAPAPEAPIAALPDTPAPAPGAAVNAGPKGLAPGLSGRRGCEDSRLTPEQHQVCVANLARLAQASERFGLDIPDQKKAAYDLHVFCRDNYRQVGIPAVGLDAVPGQCLGFGK